jgi:NFU1 iron-sulfur cluster scaffold homolog, mitochondrial
MIEVHVSPTPNPRAKKFILNVDIKATGKVSYTGAEECEHVPLAHRIFEFDDVKQVHLFENAITVTLVDEENWDTRADKIEQVIKEEAATHDVNFPDHIRRPSANQENWTPELKRIDEIISATIRPALQADGGDLELVQLEGNILSVRYQGACGGCPSSTYGTLSAIEGILRDEYDPNIEVVVV